jgi:hypothetical protein
MAYLRISEAKAVGQATRSRLQKSADQVLKEEKRVVPTGGKYDVFLSHSYDDAEVILGVKKIMEGLGLSVYVDWIDDAQLDRSKVTKETAGVLRLRMKACSSMVYAHSPSATDSKWMPWELGYFDGYKETSVWILPLVKDFDSEFKSQEYLALYPTVDKIGDLAGQANLGFANVGELRETIPLTKAARGTGIYYKTTAR